MKNKEFALDNTMLMRLMFSYYAVKEFSGSYLNRKFAVSSVNN